MSILFLSLTAAAIVLLAFTAIAGLSKGRQRNQARDSGLVRHNEPDELEEAKHLLETVMQRRLPFQGSVLATIIKGVQRGDAAFGETPG